MKIATKQAWANEDGTKLVDDGDKDARVLVSGKGQVVTPEKVKAFKNAADYFRDADTPEPTEHHTRKRVEDPDDKPKGKK